MSEDGSLFGGSENEIVPDPTTSTVTPAKRDNALVPGLHHSKAMRISSTLAQELLQSIETGGYFSTGTNQVMLFGRNTVAPDGNISSGLPEFLNKLIGELSVICRPHLPTRVFELLFPNPSDPSCARQAILNHYDPGEGISPHVDLLQRYGDGIIGVSLGSGCAMDFCKVGRTGSPGSNQISVWLEENSVIVLEGEARYGWTHGIRSLHGDVVENKTNGSSEWIPRRARTSITLRWLLPGADVVGSIE